MALRNHAPSSVLLALVGTVLIAGTTASALAQTATGAASITRNRRVERPIGTSLMLDSVPTSYYANKGGIVQDLSLDYKPNTKLEAATRGIAALPYNVPGSPNAAKIVAASHSYALQNDPNLTPTAALEFSSESTVSMNIKGIKVGINLDSNIVNAHQPVTVVWDLTYTMDTLVQRNFSAGVFDGVAQKANINASFGNYSAGGTYDYFQYGGQTPRISTSGALSGATYNTMGQSFHFIAWQTYIPIENSSKDFSFSLNVKSLFAAQYDGSGIGASESFINGALTASFSVVKGDSPRGGGFVDPDYVISSEDGLLSNEGFSPDVFIPAPGATALLGMGGLLMTRRRR